MHQCFHWKQHHCQLGALAPNEMRKPPSSAISVKTELPSGPTPPRQRGIGKLPITVRQDLYCFSFVRSGLSPSSHPVSLHMKVLLPRSSPGAATQPVSLSSAAFRFLEKISGATHNRRSEIPDIGMDAIA